MHKPLLINGQADEGRRSCYDCKWNQGAITWWCVNEQAIDRRGTLIPQTVNCPQWEAARHVDNLPWYNKLFGIPSEYVTIDLSKRSEKNG